MSNIIFALYKCKTTTSSAFQTGGRNMRLPKVPWELLYRGSTYCHVIYQPGGGKALIFFNVLINGCLKASREQLGNSFPSYSLTLWILLKVE